MKVCSRKDCLFKGELQPPENFNKKSLKRNSLISQCKTCRKEYRDFHKEKIKIQQKKWFKTHREEIKNYNQTSYRRYIRCKSRAFEKRIGFFLKLEEFIDLTSKTCLYCGEFSKEKTYTGIDRINSNKNYEIGNVVSCCKFCNFMKNKFLLNEFCSKVEKIAERIKKGMLDGYLG